MSKARSPGYPAIGLDSAIEKISMVYNKDVQNSIPREVVAKHAGYSGINGNSLSMLSSLVKYGLLAGRGNDSSVSDLALQIIAHPSGTVERSKAILEAAYKPDLFAEIRDHFKGGKVSDDALRSYLLTRKFLPSAVDGVIRAYRDTMELVAHETQGYNSALSGTAKQTNAGVGQLESADVGDTVQVEIDGAYSLEKAVRLRAIREHEGARWGFIEGSETGIPMEQVVLVQKGQPNGFVPQINPPRLAEERALPGARKEVFTLDEGDVVLTFPEGLSPESYEDLEAHLQLFLRKAKRRAANDRRESNDPGN